MSGLSGNGSCVYIRAEHIKGERKVRKEVCSAESRTMDELQGTQKTKSHLFHLLKDFMVGNFEIANYDMQRRDISSRLWLLPRDLQPQTPASG